ncbi:translation initiation factor IF-3 [candidate division KSB1 bacterium]|nr:MAG: translation initiation factor IF-3 [candidate division KSB1 bacterium]
MKEKKIRVNEQIQVPQVRVIDADGTQLGIKTIQEALKLANKVGLDLVEVAPNANPPVCKLMDFGKYRYELSKKEKEQRKKQHVIHVKEIRLRPKTDKHDLEHKIRHAKEFLESGNKVKTTVVFRGREMIYKEFGYQILTEFQEQLADTAKVEKGPFEEGRNLVIVFTKK